MQSRTWFCSFTTSNRIHQAPSPPSASPASISIRINVLFPAPFGPSSPNTSPAALKRQPLRRPSRIAEAALAVFDFHIRHAHSRHHPSRGSSASPLVHRQRTPRCSPCLPASALHQGGTAPRCPTSFNPFNVNVLDIALAIPANRPPASCCCHSKRQLPPLIAFTVKGRALPRPPPPPAACCFAITGGNPVNEIFSNGPTRKLLRPSNRSCHPGAIAIPHRIPRQPRRKRLDVSGFPLLPGFAGSNTRINHAPLRSA